MGFTTHGAALKTCAGCRNNATINTSLVSLPANPNIVVKETSTLAIGADKTLDLSGSLLNVNTSSVLSSGSTLSGGTLLLNGLNLPANRNLVLNISTIESSSHLSIAGSLTINAANLSMPTSNLTIASGGLLVFTNATPATLSTHDFSIAHTLRGNIANLAVAHDATVESTGLITANGLGGRGGGSYGTLLGEGPGGGWISANSQHQCGGSYGGNGSGDCPTNDATKTYGSIFAPVDFGSGGGGFDGYTDRHGGSGGGKIKISVSNNFVVNGAIESKGNNSGSSMGGGGSGGSIYLRAQNISGSGSINANGGSGLGEGMYNAHGGGGGRIAIYAWGTNTFSGSLTAFGGNGVSYHYSNPEPTWVFGSPGTIYSRTGSVGSLLVRGNGVQNTASRTYIKSLAETVESVSHTLDSIQVQNGSYVNFGGLTLGVTPSVDANSNSEP